MQRALHPEPEGEYALDARLGGDADRAVVELHDLPGQAETDARTPFLVEKKGDEDLVEVLLGNSDSLSRTWITGRPRSSI